MRFRALALSIAFIATAFALPASAAAPSIYWASSPVAPGDYVFVSGSGFNGTTSVTLGGLAVDNISVASDWDLRFLVPAGFPLGSHLLRVEDAEGAAEWCCIAVEEATPVVHGVWPSRVFPGDSVHLEGRHLDRVTAVALGGVDVPFSSWSYGLDFAVPQNTSAGHYVITWAWDGGAEGWCCVEVLDPDAPVMIGVYPSYAAPYDRIWVEGRNLENLTRLWVGGHAVEDFEAWHYGVSFRAPALLAGTYGVEGVVTVGNTTGNGTWGDRYVWTCCLTIDPWLPRADLAVEIVDIEKSTVRTDFTDPVTNPFGTQTITVEVTNRGNAWSEPTWGHAEVVQDGIGFDATWLGDLDVPALAPGDAWTAIFEWNPGDVVGDATVHARIFTDSGDPSDDADEEETFVLVGGLGGANVPLVT